jgi:vacuole morphology and inheritance protein 14
MSTPLNGDSIVSLSIVRGLSDKLYEKRKLAALEIEKLVRDNTSKDFICSLLDFLERDYVNSMLPNNRNGGKII